MERKMSELSGLVQTLNENTKERTEIGRIALWSNNSENQKAPKYVEEIRSKRWRKQVQSFTLDK